MKLQNGDMPNVSEAIDLGTVPEGVAPKILGPNPANPTTGDFARFLDQHSGTKIPPHRRVLMAIQHYRGQELIDMNDTETVYRAEIKGLGTLVFQADCKGWGVDWAVLDKSGGVVEG